MWIQVLSWACAGACLAAALAFLEAWQNYIARAALLCLPELVVFCLFYESSNATLSTTLQNLIHGGLLLVGVACFADSTQRSSPGLSCVIVVQACGLALLPHVEPAWWIFLLFGTSTLLAAILVLFFDAPAATNTATRARALQPLKPLFALKP